MAGPTVPNSAPTSVLPGGDVPPLPPDATPEQKDAHWYKHVYAGDRVPQLTLRAVLMGGFIGMLMSVSNLYTTVKLGWSFGVAITACVLSYVIWNAVRALTGKRMSQMSILENTCMASTASAAGYSTGGTVGTAFGALLLIQGVHMDWTIVTPFVFLTAALGVFLAIPMKRQMINHEQLPFPSGIAAAETLRSLYSEGREAVEKAYSLVIAMFAGMVVAFFRSYEGLVELLKAAKKAPEWLVNVSHWLKIPDLMDFPSVWLVSRGKVAGWGFEPSALLVAAGMIVGLRVSLSMLVGSLILYVGFVPWLHGMDAAEIAAGTANYRASFTLSAAGDFNPMRWSLWAGTALMVFSSLTVVAIQWKTVLRAFKVGRGTKSSPDAADAIEVPGSWLVVGLIPIGIGLIILQHYAFQMSWWLGAIAVAMSFPLGLVACRATGETDTTPIGAMGKVTQLIYALVARGDSVINLTSAGVTAGAAGASADLLTDLKSGYLLGANPRRQFLAQFYGCFFGTLMIVPAWYLMFPDKATLDSYNPPAANMWRAVAEALTQGLDFVPKTAQIGIVIGGLLGILMPLIEVLVLPAKYRKYFPSAMGLGLAWVVPFQNAFSFAIGAVITYIWTRIFPKAADKYNVPIASGLVAGESLLAAFIAIAGTLVGIATMRHWW
ncbi:MAG TPA: OPT family oligopeptide transporter [Phycisphaerales bacterium]|nr:OPT family oligopeptide transporter [Phycisphaerales bacterium]